MMLCDTCDRPMRPQKTSPADYPGTVIHGAYGDCSGCYQKNRRLDEPEPGPNLSADELCRLPGSVRVYLTERRRRLGVAA